MIVSINPLYRCNFRCPNCYLTARQLASRTILPLPVLRDLLQDLPTLTAVEVYGGEVTLLQPSYVAALKRVIREVYPGPIAVTTNLYQRPDWLWEDDITLNVSFDFEHRPHHEQVLNNILLAPKPLHLIILATPAVMAGDVDAQMTLVASLNNVVSVEIKPYSSNQANHWPGTNRQYVEYVQRWIEGFPNERLYNVALLNAAVNGQRRAYSDNHIYITPHGKYGVLEFDAQDREYFQELDDYAAYRHWCEAEKTTLLAPACRSCEFKGRCLTEHYRRQEGVNDECSGFKSLLTWWLAR